MLAVFTLTTAKDKCWWNYCRSLWPPDTSTSFFARQLRKGAVDLPYISGFYCNCLKVIIVKEVIAFSPFICLSIICYTAWFSVADYIVAWNKDVHNCHMPYEAPAPVPRVQSQIIRLVIPHQANGLQDRWKTNVGQ